MNGLSGGLFDHYEQTPVRGDGAPQGPETVGVLGKVGIAQSEQPSPQDGVGISGGQVRVQGSVGPLVLLLMAPCGDQCCFPDPGGALYGDPHGPVTDSPGPIEPSTRLVAVQEQPRRGKLTWNHGLGRGGGVDMKATAMHVTHLHDHSGRPLYVVAQAAPWSGCRQRVKSIKDSACRSLAQVRNSCRAPDRSGSWMRSAPARDPRWVWRRA